MLQKLALSLGAPALNRFWFPPLVTYPTRFSYNFFFLIKRRSSWAADSNLKYFRKRWYIRWDGRWKKQKISWDYPLRIILIFSSVLERIKQNW